MSTAPFAVPGNDPFAGGSYESLTVPSGGNRLLPAPGGGGGSLQSGVAGGAPFFARNNRGSNISIPYARVVALPNTSSALPKQSEAVGDFLRTETRQNVEVIRETDELAKARIAWIMGRRAKISQAEEFMVQIGSGGVFADQAALGNMGYDPTVQGETGISARGTHWDMGKGVNRSSRLCSTEYLMRLYEVAMRRAYIQLSVTYDDDTRGGPAAGATNAAYDLNNSSGLRKPHFPHYKGGMLGTYTRPAKRYGDCGTKGRQPLVIGVGPNAGQGNNNGVYPGQVPLVGSSSMTFTNNILFAIATRDMANANRKAANDSDAVRSADMRDTNVNGDSVNQIPDRNFKCGIFTRSLSPFLHGRTLCEGVSASAIWSDVDYPMRKPDALGDHFAFAALEEAMTRIGLLDWRPDGVVNSKLENGPDAESDAMYNAKDGQLFNVHVQGPAICSNFTGTEFSRGLVAGDKVFVAIVADCWNNCGTANTDPAANQFEGLPTAIKLVLNNESPSRDQLAAAAAERKRILNSHAENPREVDASQHAVELLRTKLFSCAEMTTPPNGAADFSGFASPHLLTNFRIRYVTSSEMIETSGLMVGPDGEVVMNKSADMKWHSGSRMGLAFSRVQYRDGNAQAYDAAIDCWSTDDGVANRGPPLGASLSEVIVGAWHIGTVLDTAASRGAGRGFASHRYDSAANLNVDIEWWSGDRMYKAFANRPNTGQAFKMRGQPQFGFTTNRPGVGNTNTATEGSETHGADGTLASKPTVTTVNPNATTTDELRRAIKALIDVDPSTPAGLTDLQKQNDARRAIIARNTFPDPMDLPAAVKMVRINPDDTVNNAPSAFAGIGQQRGIVHPGNQRRYGYTAAPSFSDIPPVAEEGRLVLKHPGNSLHTEYLDYARPLLTPNNPRYDGFSLRTQGETVTIRGNFDYN